MADRIANETIYFDHQGVELHSVSETAWGMGSAIERFTGTRQDGTRTCAKGKVCIGKRIPDRVTLISEMQQAAA